MSIGVGKLLAINLIFFGTGIASKGCAVDRNRD
jgi:hypothetical protein